LTLAPVRTAAFAGRTNIAIWRHRRPVAHERAHSVLATGVAAFEMRTVYPQCYA